MRRTDRSSSRNWARSSEQGRLDNYPFPLSGVEAADLVLRPRQICDPPLQEDGRRIPAAEQVHHLQRRSGPQDRGRPADLDRGGRAGKVAGTVCAFPEVLFEEKGRCIRSALFVSMGMKKGPSERAVLDGTGCGGAVPSSRGRKGSAAACRRSGKHEGSIALWPGKAMPRARSVQFDTLSRRQGRMRAGRARPGAEDRPAGLCLR